MARHAYVELAGTYERLIRSGELSPGSRLHSYADIAAEAGVSEIVVRKAIEMLLSQGLVRSVRRKGVFVSDHPNSVRISPERQMESAEETYDKETTETEEVQIERDIREVKASAELAEMFNLIEGSTLRHTVTRATAGGRPASISDTWQPVDLEGIQTASELEETLSDRVPGETHGAWLKADGLVKVVRQRFIAPDGHLVMYSEVSYPRDRYDGYLFRMSLGAVKTSS